MLGNSYGITGLIIGHLRGLVGFEVKFVNYQIKKNILNNECWLQRSYKYKINKL